PARPPTAGSGPGRPRTESRPPRRPPRGDELVGARLLGHHRVAKAVHDESPYFSRVSSRRSSSSATDSNTATAPASVSCCSEKPPLMTVIVCTPAFSAAFTSHG